MLTDQWSFAADIQVLVRTDNIVWGEAASNLQKASDCTLMLRKCQYKCTWDLKSCINIITGTMNILSYISLCQSCETMSLTWIYWKISLDDSNVQFFNDSVYHISYLKFVLSSVTVSTAFLICHTLQWKVIFNINQF